MNTRSSRRDGRAVRRRPERARPLRRLRESIAATAASVATRRRSIAFFLTAALLFFTAGPVLRYFAGHRYFAVREIEVEGLERLDTAQVLVWLGMGEGSSIWAASPRVLERRLEERPAIDHASVRRIWPDRLHVSVRERAPSAT